MAIPLLRRVARSDHELRTHLLVKLFRCQEAKTHSRLLEREALVVRLLRRLGDVVVAETRVQGCRKHKRLVQQLINALLVRLDAHDTVVRERVCTVSEQTNAREQVLCNHRLEDVQLKLAVRATDRHGHMVAHNLRGDHRQSLTLRRVHLARHDRRARLVLRQRQLTKTTAWTRAEVPNVVGNLHERHGHRVPVSYTHLTLPTSDLV